MTRRRRRSPSLWSKAYELADFRITGAASLAKAASVLKAQGDAAGRKELLKGIQQATKPLKADVKRSAQTSLPRRGGLNQAVAASTFSTRTRTTGKSVGVRLVVKGRRVRDVAATDRGRLRHPVFGSDVWVTQSITPGWFTRPLEAGAPAVRRELVASMERVVREIGRKTR